MGQVFRKVIKLQLLATGIIASLAYMLAGLHGSFSAVAGGGAAILGSLAAATLLCKNKKSGAGEVLVGLLKAEAVKVLIIAIVLLMFFKLYHGLIPLAMICGLGVAALLSGAAITGINEQSN